MCRSSMPFCPAWARRLPCWRRSLGPSIIVLMMAVVAVAGNLNGAMLARAAAAGTMTRRGPRASVDLQAAWRGCYTRLSRAPLAQWIEH